MVTRALPKEEVKKRLIRLRNLEHLHEQQRIKIWRLRDENRVLRKEVVLLKAAVTAQQHTINDLQLQIEELRILVFGRKRKKGDGNGDDTLPPVQTNLSVPRTKESYRRSMPRADEITETKDHPIDQCATCQGRFSERERVVCFEEDIPLPQKKTVTKHVIGRGYCDSCRKWSASVPLPVADVVLGGNVKRYVAYLSVVCRQSYTQIQDVLLQTYDFRLSQGEIAKILEKEGVRLRPEYERLKASIRGEPSVHLDETGWNLFIGDGYRRYAWTMVGGESADALFMLGKTRGKGNADDLLGTSEAVVVSDDYGAYRNLTQPHQLCLAHIVRKLRDLAQSGELKEAMHAHCLTAYNAFAAIYADIEAARTSSDPAASHGALYGRLKAFATISMLDPAKLTRVKAQVGARAENYLTCLRYPGVASDNNAAERSLRHLVLKRKISFGSLTEGTAQTTAVLLSVLMSWKRRGELGKYLAGV